MKGCLWNDLTNSEKDEIRKQLPRIESDPGYKEYRFRKAMRGRWLITNAMLIPLSTAKVGF